MRYAATTVSPASGPYTPRLSARRWVWFVVVTAAVIAAVVHFGANHASADPNAIRSGVSGACLDTYHDGAAAGTPVDAAPCNSTGAQAWVTTATAIRRAGSGMCLSTTPKGAAVLGSCADVPAQVWLRDQNGYFNPNTGKCLDSPAVGTQLQLAACGSTLPQSEIWLPASAAQAPTCAGSEGQAVACEAAKEWTTWQAAGSNHEALLTSYTDGTPYEEWCADFVSYVYKEAGYAFTDGSADGWDENNASDVQYMGFTLRSAASGYVPQAGDVAFFDYPGGHVEIVVSGGRQPTFVYGDSAQTDPTTGNGQMKANTITSDGEEGSVVYYLSPIGA